MHHKDTGGGGGGGGGFCPLPTSATFRKENKALDQRLCNAAVCCCCCCCCCCRAHSLSLPLPLPRAPAFSLFPLTCVLTVTASRLKATNTFPPRLLTTLRLLLSSDHELAAIQAWKTPPLVVAPTHVPIPTPALPPGTAAAGGVGDDAIPRSSNGATSRRASQANGAEDVEELGPLANLETEFGVLCTLADLVATQAAKLQTGASDDAAALAGAWTGDGAADAAACVITSDDQRRRVLCAIYRAGQRATVANALASAERLRDEFHRKHMGTGLALQYGFDWSGETNGTRLQGWSSGGSGSSAANVPHEDARGGGGGSAANGAPDAGEPDDEVSSVTDELPGERLVAASTAMSTPVLGEALAQVQGLDEETLLRLLLVRNSRAAPAPAPAQATAEAHASEGTDGAATVARGSLLQWSAHDWSHFGAAAAAAAPGSVGLAGELKAAVADHQADLDDAYDSLFPALSDALPAAFDPAVYTMPAFVDASVEVWARATTAADNGVISNTAHQPVLVVTPEDVAPVPHASIPTAKAVLSAEGNGMLRLVNLIKPLQQSTGKTREDGIPSNTAAAAAAAADDDADDDDDDDDGPELLPAAVCIEAGIDNATLMARCGICSEDNPNESLTLSIAYLRLLGAFPPRRPSQPSDVTADGDENERHVLTRQGLPSSFYAALEKCGVVPPPHPENGEDGGGGRQNDDYGLERGGGKAAKTTPLETRQKLLVGVAIGALNKYRAALETHLGRMGSAQAKRAVQQEGPATKASKDRNARFDIAATFVTSKCALLEDAACSLSAALRTHATAYS